MNAGMNAVLTENLKTLKLSTMLGNLKGHLRQAQQDQIGYDEFLLNLTEIEVQVRKENGRKRRLREAKFPLLKPLETFNFEAAADLDARLIKDLSNCDYVKKSRNVIFLGKSGTGKTHLATALGMEACKQGVRTRFVTGCGLANELIEARDEKVLARTVKRYAGYGLLIIDELGYVPFSQEGAQLIFQILVQRVGIAAVDLDLIEHLKTDTIVHQAAFLDALGVTRLLRTELIAGKAQDGQAGISIFFM